MVHGYNLLLLLKRLGRFPPTIHRNDFFSLFLGGGWVPKLGVFGISIRSLYSRVNDKVFAQATAVQQNTQAQLCKTRWRRLKSVANTTTPLPGKPSRYYLPVAVVRPYIANITRIVGIINNNTIMYMYNNIIVIHYDLIVYL